MKKVLTLLLCCLLFIPAAHAEEASWLTFRMVDGSEISVAAQNLEITYVQGKLQLAGASVNQELTVAQIKSMQFTSTPASLVQLSGEDSAEESLYYSATGVAVGSFASIDEAKKSLAPGVYIIKNGTKSIKIIF